MHTYLVYGTDSNQRELAFTGLQFQCSQSCIRALQERKTDTGICHICNSKATTHAPGMHMDMARVGAYIFGLASASEQRLMPLREVLIWKARIVLLRDIAAGEGVGYGRAFIAKQPVRTAVLAAGFADGYWRCIVQSPQSCISVHGRSAPLIGKVRMDTFMADVTDIEAV